MARSRQPAFDAALWFLWIMATTLGWLLGSLLFTNLALVPAGVGVAAMQSFVLHHRIPRAWRWFLATSTVWLVVSTLLLAMVPAPLQGLVGGVILGPTLGLAQWLLLRHEVLWAGWWIVVSTMAWITGLALLPGILSTGALAGAITGVALTLLLHYPKPASTPQSKAESRN
ncbi:MAG: hypothetical protein GX597_13980 [Anaerolineaceae bacterium]|nr:hypothetical protein [Anaerolineaceae bacterium]